MKMNDTEGKHYAVRERAWKKRRILLQTSSAITATDVGTVSTKAS